MPRVKSVATIEKPVSGAAKGRRTRAIDAGSAVVTQRKPRRSPYEVVQELKERREALAKTYQERLAKLDGRIKRLEARYEKKILVTQLLSTKTPEELALELAAIKKHQSILKKALKAHR
jgi:TolA-binding protein